MSKFPNVHISLNMMRNGILIIDGQISGTVTAPAISGLHRRYTDAIQSEKRIDELETRQCAYDEGYAAALKGEPYRNPYPEGSTEYCGYSFGWFAVGHERECQRMEKDIQEKNQSLKHWAVVANNFSKKLEACQAELKQVKSDLNKYLD